MKRTLLVLALAIVGASADAQMGWRLSRVQQYFVQTGERQKFDPTGAKGIFQGRTLYSFHTGAYDVRVGFDADGTSEKPRVFAQYKPVDGFRLLPLL